MKTDIEIAQSAKMRPIAEIAKNAGIDEKYVEQYGKYKAKIDLSIMNEVQKPDGKLVLVTAITPTPAGEGENDNDNRSCRRTVTHRQKGCHRPARAVARSCFRYQRRRGGRRLCSGCADGGYQPAFYW